MTKLEIEVQYYRSLEERHKAAKNYKGQVAGRHPDNFVEYKEKDHMTRGYMEAIEEVLNNPEKYGLISREKTFIVGGSLFDTLSTKSKRMTNEQVEDEFYALTEKVMQYLKNNHHPHTRIFITSDTAELVEGVMNNHRSTLVDERKEAFNKLMEEAEMKISSEGKKEVNQENVTNWIKSEFGDIPPDEMYSKNLKIKTTSS